MNTVLQIQEQTISAEEIIQLLNRYRLLPQFQREFIIDQAIADIDYTEDELIAFKEQLTQVQHPETEMDDEVAVRYLKIQKFKRAKWQPHLGSYFLQRKAQLDQLIYSLIRTRDEGLAYELYFRIRENEQTFAELATTYSEGPEARTGGLIGPVELGAHRPQFERLLATAQVGQLNLPVWMDGWCLVLRVEERIPAQFNEAMQQYLLDELFTDWVQQQSQDRILQEQTTQEPA